MIEKFVVMDEKLINLAGAHFLSGELLRRGFNPYVPKLKSKKVQMVLIEPDTANEWAKFKGMMGYEYNPNIPRITSKTKDYANVFVTNKRLNNKQPRFNQAHKNL